MNKKSPYTIESAAVMKLMSEAIKLARRSRKETIQMAADRLGLSPASIKRMESGDVEQVASLGAGALVTALCSFGYADGLAAGIKPAIDEQGDFLRRRAVMGHSK